MQDEQERSRTEINQITEERSQPTTEPDDPRLDFAGPGFDAELALQTPHLQPPVPDAPVLDNVSKCTGFLPASEDAQAQQKEAGNDTQQMTAKKAKAAAFKQRARQATQRAEASVKLGSLADIMAIAAAPGPLAVLAKWHAAGQRIYVVTRHASGVRGRAVGTLVAFDKFMNLLLRDVEEAYTVIVKVQRLKQQTSHSQQQLHNQQLDHQQQHEQQQPVPENVDTSRIRTRWCRKQQHRFRQLDQVLVRGDNIVLISGTPPALQLPHEQKKDAAPTAAGQSAL